MKLIGLVLIFSLFALRHTATALENLKLTVSISDYYIGTKPYEEVLSFVKTSVARDNIHVEFTPLPLERASILANSGEMDGEIAPGELKTNMYPNLIQASFPLIITKYPLIYRKGEPPTKKNISSLRGVIPLNIRGIEEFLRKEKLSTLGVKTSSSALEMVAKKRADYAIVSDIIFKFDQQEKYPSLEISKEFFATVPIYFRLNKKHKNILPKIESDFQKEKRQNFHKYPAIKDYFAF